jgi:hypothetical protein
MGLFPAMGRPVTITFLKPRKEGDVATFICLAASSPEKVYVYMHMQWGPLWLVLANISPALLLVDLPFLSVLKKKAT